MLATMIVGGPIASAQSRNVSAGLGTQPKPIPLHCPYRFSCGRSAKITQPTTTGSSAVRHSATRYGRAPRTWTSPQTPTSPRR